MIITRTPFRISLFGGGTDFPQWYNDHGGSVLGFALNKYCWVTLRELPPFFDYKYRIVYSTTETAKTAAEIKHRVVREILRANKPHNRNGLEIHHDGDIPAHTGLGSSSSFTVGLLRAVDYFHSQTPFLKRNLANSAILVEQVILNEAVGSQDQIWAAWGGFNRINFRQDWFDVDHMPASRTHDLINCLALFFTGFQRKASEIETVKLEKIKQNYTQLKRIQTLVDEAETIIKDEKRPITDIGPLLHETWKMKRELAKNVVSTPELDDIYHHGLMAGAIGGKLLGAGGGGFFLFCIPPQLKGNLRKELQHLIEVPIGIDWEGSKIIYPKTSSHPLP